MVKLNDDLMESITYMENCRKSSTKYMEKQQAVVDTHVASIVNSVNAANAAASSIRAVEHDMGGFQNQVARLETQLREVQEKHEEELKDIHAQLKAIQTRQDAQMKEIQSRQDTQLKEMQSKYDTQLKEMQSKQEQMSGLITRMHGFMQSPALLESREQKVAAADATLHYVYSLLAFLGNVKWSSSPFSFDGTSDEVSVDASILRTWFDTDQDLVAIWKDFPAFSMLPPNKIHLKEALAYIGSHQDLTISPSTPLMEDWSLGSQVPRQDVPAEFANAFQDLLKPVRDNASTGAWWQIHA